jgi:hypothetical protein
MKKNSLLYKILYKILHKIFRGDKYFAFHTNDRQNPIISSSDLGEVMEFLKKKKVDDWMIIESQNGNIDRDCRCICSMASFKKAAQS